MNKKQDARALDLFGKEDLRRRTVRAVIQQGLSKAKAARVFGVSRTSVHWWVDLYEKHGESGLTPKRPGRPKCGGRLKGRQAATTVNSIKDHCPDQRKMPFALWTCEAVRDLFQVRILSIDGFRRLAVWSFSYTLGDAIGSDFDLLTSRTTIPDQDDDGVSDVVDDCTVVANTDQPETDEDGVGDACDVCPDSQPGSTVGANGRPLGDLNDDCHVDLADFDLFQPNFTGPRE